MRDPCCAESLALCRSLGKEVVRPASRQICVTHQEAVTFARGAAAFVERPDDETLAAATIARGEDAFDVRRVFLEFSLRVRARVAFDAE